MRKRNQYLPLGSYSEGTLRDEDVIPILFDTLCEYGTRKEVAAIKREYKAELAFLARYEEDLTEDTENPLYLSDLWQTLEDTLQAHCAPYTYFGTAEGDGASFGVWIDFDSIREDVRDLEILEVSDTSEIPRKHEGLVVLINDHGNCALYRANKGRLREVWSIV